MEAKNSWRKLKRSGTFKRKVNRNFRLLKSTEKSTTPTDVVLVTNDEEEKCATHEQQKVDDVKSVPSGSTVVTYDDYTSDHSELSSPRESIIESSDTDGDKDNTFREDLRKWALDFNISHQALKSLSGIVNKRLPNIVPNDPRTLLRTNEINLYFSSVGTGKYWHNGLSLQLQETLEHIDDVPNIISLLFNIDGLPLYNSSRHQVWPILCQIYEKRHLSPIVVGIYEGTSKPTDIDAYLSHLVTELKDLLQNPMEIKTKKGLQKICTVQIRAFICDSPARALIKGCTGNNIHTDTRSTHEAHNGMAELPSGMPRVDYTAEHDRPLDSGPRFDISASRNVTALVGKSAQLNCRVHNLGNRTVSWIRHRDIHLLTSGRMTYTSDQRFVSVHNPHTEDWTLKIRFPQRRDSGIYECQVGTTPPVGHHMYLSVVEPITTIVGGPELFINTGSTLNLTCIVRHSPEPPPTIYWTHNNEEINYDSARGGVSVITEKGEVTTSYLLVQRARAPDSGHYTCSPANANPRTVLVHVLNGEHPAAMQHGGQLRLEYPFGVILLSVIVAIMGC